MIDRRDLLFGAGCAAALGGAELLRPRQTINLVGNKTLKEIIPEQIGDWTLDPSSEPILPPSEGSLTDRLYDELLARAYVERSNRALPPVMMLCTHGSVQSDALQLHRPETCYPALGFGITDRALVEANLLPGLKVPAVRLTARSGPRVEDILYWTRIGFDFPQTASEQRRDRLIAAARGFVGDGILLRLSAVRTSDRPQHDYILSFARALAASIAVGGRRALFGNLAG